MAMTYSDAEIFLKNGSHFPADSTACAYHLATHSLLVDLMHDENSLFTVTYQHCVQALQSHLLLSIHLHYGEDFYMIALQIMYWLTQQFLYFLSQHKFGATPQLPAFEALLQHTQMKTLDGFLGCLHASWMEQVKPTEKLLPGGMSPS